MNEMHTLLRCGSCCRNNSILQRDYHCECLRLLLATLSYPLRSLLPTIVHVHQTSNLQSFINECIHSTVSPTSFLSPKDCQHNTLTIQSPLANTSPSVARRGRTPCVRLYLLMRDLSSASASTLDALRLKSIY
jgi:hypothetical protein